VSPIPKSACPASRPRSCASRARSRRPHPSPTAQRSSHGLLRPRSRSRSPRRLRSLRPGGPGVLRSRPAAHRLGRAPGSSPARARRRRGGARRPRVLRRACDRSRLIGITERVVMAFAASGLLTAAGVWLGERGRRLQASLATVGPGSPACTSRSSQRVLPTTSCRSRSLSRRRSASARSRPRLPCAGIRNRSPASASSVRSRLRSSSARALPVRPSPTSSSRSLLRPAFWSGGGGSGSESRRSSSPFRRSSSGRSTSSGGTAEAARAGGSYWSSR